ncbi:MAG: hypothetical protein FWD15_03365 [Alphaproteobacteria bacterium]|nr:hypothetical protein [Alphaproteobacteria bacterium]
MIYLKRSLAIAITPITHQQTTPSRAAAVLTAHRLRGGGVVRAAPDGAGKLKV